jgi:branched-subunit amino acid ABC-type transport system permease component
MITLKNLNVKAVVIGTAVDILGTLIASLVIGVVWGLAYAASKGGGTPPNPEEMAKLFQTSFSFLLASLVLGLVFVMVGGFVAAHLARRAELPNALAMGFLSLILAGVMVVISPDAGPAWYAATGIILTVPAALLGGYLRLQTRSQEGFRPRTSDRSDFDL